MVDQVKGEFEVKDPLLQRYYDIVSSAISKFDTTYIEHIWQENIVREDLLSRLSSTKKKSQSHHCLVIHIYLKTPSVGRSECSTVMKDEVWMALIRRLLEDESCGKKNDKSMRQRCAWFVLVRKDLYRIGYIKPLLKCKSNNLVEYVMDEIQQGVCNTHSGARTMTTKVLMVEHYWPTI